MTTEERAIAALKMLPPNKQEEALDFIEFLQARLQPVWKNRQEIDAALLEMTSDPDYQEETLKIEAEFADSLN
jgi:uncharacterized hydantoinase/oxoprolinase family protein